MNPIDRLGPFVYSVLHAHNMLWELMLTPSERRTAQKDIVRLRRRLPFFEGYEHSSVEVCRGLQEKYDAYVSTVSPAPIAVSLELATFLALTCEAYRPKAILDLGAGFSSYVFRAYAKGANARPIVYSVDQSSGWLAKTEQFLREQRLDVSHMYALETFLANERPPFDVALLDVADLATREQLLDLTITSCRPGGLIVIDDMHVPRYRRSITQALSKRGLDYFSLRTLTLARGRLRYSYLVIT